MRIRFSIECLYAKGPGNPYRLPLQDQQLDQYRLNCELFRRTITWQLSLLERFHTAPPAPSSYIRCPTPRSPSSPPDGRAPSGASQKSFIFHRHQVWRMQISIASQWPSILTRPPIRLPTTTCLRSMSTNPRTLSMAERTPAALALPQYQERSSQGI